MLAALRHRAVEDLADPLVERVARVRHELGQPLGEVVDALLEVRLHRLGGVEDRGRHAVLGLDPDIAGDLRLEHDRQDRRSQREQATGERVDEQHHRGAERADRVDPDVVLEAVDRDLDRRVLGAEPLGQGRGRRGDVLVGDRDDLFGEVLEHRGEPRALELGPLLELVLDEHRQVELDVVGVDRVDLAGQRVDERLGERLEVEADLVLDRLGVGVDPDVELVELALRRIELLADLDDAVLELAEIEIARVHPHAEVVLEVARRARRVAGGVIEDDLGAVRARGSARGTP